MVSSAAADYDHALESYLKEDYIQAASRFDRFVSESSGHPKLPLAIYYSAICRLKLDQPKPAIERLQFLLSSAPDTIASPSLAMVRLAIGEAYHLLGDETSALSYFESSWLSAANAFERSAARDKIKDIRMAWVSVPRAPVQEPREPVLAARPEDPPAPAGWVVQVKSTQDQSQAESIRAQIQTGGWPVYTEATAVKGATFYRVRVGPYPAESEAGAAKRRLQSRFGFEGWVTRK